MSENPRLIVEQLLRAEEERAAAARREECAALVPAPSAFELAARAVEGWIQQRRGLPEVPRGELRALAVSLLQLEAE